MEFKKKMKQRFCIAVSYILVGLALIAVDWFQGSMNSFLFPFGLALTVMGILRIFRYRKITKDDASIRRQELMENDERYRMMAERARSWAFSFSVMAAGILVIILSLLGKHDLALPFAWFVCGMTVLYWICWNILRKKY